MNEWYGSPPPPQPRKKSGHGRNLIGGLVLLALPVLGVGTYVMLQRLSDEVLTIIAVIGCAGGLAIPVLFVSMIVLLRRAESNSRENHAPPPQPPMTQPMMMVVPPMALPHQSPYPQPQSLWEQEPITRRFTVVGDEPEM